MAIVSSNRNGNVIWYKCNTGFDKSKTGHVECDHGRWNGALPECGDTRCNKASLNYPGLVRQEGFLNRGESFEPKCIDGYEVTENSNRKISCNNGEWTGNLPPCTIGRCSTESLLRYSGIILQGYQKLDEGEWLEPMCAEGFEFSNKNDSKLYCREGQWTGNVPPCTPAHCLNDPPIPEHGRIKSMHAKGHGSAVEYECLPFYELQGGNNVICAYGTWSGSSPYCTDSRCYRRNLPEKDGVDLSNDQPTYTGQFAVINCTKGYSLKFRDVRCMQGTWETENALSPCQEDLCQVQYITNGDILEKKLRSIKNWIGTEIGVKTVYEKINTGISKISGESLYVKCSDGYAFQGEQTEELVEIKCRRGKWTPFPICQSPGEQLIITETTQSKKESLSPTPQPDNNLTISDEREESENITLDDSDKKLPVLEMGTTENGDESLLPDVTVLPTCTCKYNVDDSNLKAYDANKKIFKFGDEIPRGTVVGFYCTDVGVYRIRGSTSAKCPSDCNWHSSTFPSCVRPNDDDVIIRIASQPLENMKVGLGGVINVIPRADVTLTCRVNVGRKISVNWIPPPSSTGTKEEVRSASSGIYRMHYFLRGVTDRDNGVYTCISQYGTQRRSIEIKVTDIECPKIEDSGEMVVSYSDNKRPFKSSAYFHCFSPNKRDGPSSVTCEASGLWSAPPPTCQLPTCPIGSLHDVVPEGVVPLIEEDIGANVPYGYVMKLFCEESGRVIKGGNTATCSTDEKWETEGTIECVQGCAGLVKKEGSKLLITPDKEYYSMGELLTFSCPAGKKLTTESERILCFGSGWTPSANTPDCQ